MRARKHILTTVLLGLVLIVGIGLTACDEGAPPPGVSQNAPATSNTPTPASTPVPGVPATATSSSAVQKDIDPNTLATRLPLKVDATSILEQGEAAGICGVNIRVNSLTRQSKKGTGGRKDLMVASVGLESKADKQVAIIPYDFYLSDAAGKVMELSYGGEVKTPLAGGQLDPGKTMGGEVAYDVTVDQKDFKLLWMPGWCADKAVVAVQETQQ
jgi:hypothetical protein